MKKLNIRWKIMVWHSLALLLIFIAILPIMYLIISNHLYKGAETLLLSEAGKVVAALRLGDGMDEPNSEIDLIQTGTYIAVYSDTNVIISGRLPDEFDFDAKPVFNGAYYERAAGHKWLVLDRELIVNGKRTGWFRVIKSLDAISSALAYYRTIMCIIIPLIIIVSALTMIGGGFISRALSPVKQITKTAQQIGQGNLSRRINLEGSHDEVGVLAQTFDKMLDRLEDSFDREKRFTADVSHELRTPVTAIIVNAEEALVGDKAAEEYKENLNTILHEGKKMNSLISQLLMMARSIDGNYVQEMEHIDLSALTQTIVEEVTEREENSDVTISADIDEGIVMLFDQTLYMRLLYNLIDNALKYNMPGGWVNVSLKKQINAVLLSVEDNGIGISEDELPKIWSRFYKVNQSTINSSPGLGLSIVKWVAEQSGGIVRVTSELGKGSLFEVLFQVK